MCIVLRVNISLFEENYKRDYIKQEKYKKVENFFVFLLSLYIK